MELRFSNRINSNTIALLYVNQIIISASDYTNLRKSLHSSPTSMRIIMMWILLWTTFNANAVWLNGAMTTNMEYSWWWWWWWWVRWCTRKVIKLLVYGVVCIVYVYLGCSGWHLNYTSIETNGIILIFICISSSFAQLEIAVGAVQLLLLQQWMMEMWDLDAGTYRYVCQLFHLIIQNRRNVIIKP